MRNDHSVAAHWHGEFDETQFQAWAQKLRTQLRAPGVELLEGAKRDGCVIVLITEMLDLAVAPLAKRLGADHLIANRMEVQGGRATGRP